MKLMWKEHKRTCRKKKTDNSIASVTATDVLVEHLAGLKVGQRRFWLEAALNQADHNDATPLYFAYQEGQMATVRALEKAGALRYIPFVHW